MKNSLLINIFTNKKFILGVIGILLVVLSVLIILRNINLSSGIRDVTVIKENRSFSCTYKGQEHKFNIYFPDSFNTTQSAPLVIMLHGYGNNGESFASLTHFEKEGCEAGYVVVYPTSTPDSKGEIGWNSGLGDSDKDDVGFICALVNYLQKEYNCDKNRTFAVGFSNGAFMTQRLAVDASDTFTAIAGVAGMMPEKTWNSRKETTDIGVLEIYGTKDDVVPMKLNGSDQTSNAPAIEDVMSYWAKANNLSVMEEEKLSDKAVCNKYSNPENSNFVWTIVIQDGRHSWPDKSFAGFAANDIILEFFEQYK